jgi:hypothetical protein
LRKAPRRPRRGEAREEATLEHKRATR